MNDGTLLSIEGRPALRFERVMPHSLDRVWHAVSVPAELEQWFPAAAPWTPATGEHFEVGGMSGQVTEARPPHRLAWTFAGDDYSFELAQHGDGCLLVFIHVFHDRSTAAQTAAGWHSYFSRLERHLAGENLSEHAAHHGWAEVHEHYADAFGVDPAPGRRFAEQLHTDHD